jgi:hypothetical protein
MSAQLPLPARWAHEVADPTLRDPEERLADLARDKRTVSRSIHELVEWLVVRHGGSPAQAAVALDAYLDTMIDNATLAIRERAYDELRDDDVLWRFLQEVARRPMARHTVESDD